MEGRIRAREEASPEDAGRAYVFSTMALSGTVSSGELVLHWTPWPGTSWYWVYGADNCAQFDPGLSPPYSHRLATLFGLVTAWACSAGVGDVDHNWTYQVVAVNASEQPISVSNRWGEHDFQCGAARQSKTSVAQD